MDPQAPEIARALLASLEPLVCCEVGPALDFRHGDGLLELERPATAYDPESATFYCAACQEEIDEARLEADQAPIAWIDLG